MRPRPLLLLFACAALACREGAPELGPLERRAEAIRGLTFRSPVATRVLDDAAMRRKVRDEVDRETSSPEWAGEEAALKAFGLVPRKMDLRRALRDLLDSQVVGFYDPRGKTLFLAENAGSGLEEDPLEGLPLPEDFSVRDLFLIHELDHALVDQRLGLLALLPLEDKENGDRAGAARCVAEGDATWVMFRYAVEALKATPAQEAKMADLVTTMGAGKNLLGGYPEYLQENLLIAYLGGYSLVKAVVEKRGTAGLDDLYRHPPASMEQVLHPEKYLAGQDPPLAVEARLPEGSPLAGWTRLHGGVWGEFDTRLVLKAWGVPEAEATRAAAGWGGDAYALFRAPDGRTGFFW